MSALETVLVAAAERAAELEYRASNPFTVLGQTTSAKAVDGWVATQRAEANAIRSAITELRAT